MGRDAFSSQSNSHHVRDDAVRAHLSVIGEALGQATALHLSAVRRATGRDKCLPVHHADSMPVLESTDENINAKPITLGLAIRRTRLIVFTLSMLVIILGFTVWFYHGLAVSHFDSRDKNATEQNHLLDDYNAYTGNVAAIFATPVELFVTVAVQVIVWRFMADTFTRPEMSWKISGITLLLGAGVGYMISNGFNALNVQLRSEQIRSVISSADLGLENIIDAREETVDAMFFHPFSELEHQNPVSNTVLRSSLFPKIPLASLHCTYSAYRDGVNVVNETVDEVPHSFLHLGFPQREWQSRILHEALPTAELRVIVNPTNKAINSGVNSSALPMSAETAAFLFHDAMVYGLLPSDEVLAASETTQKDWFVRASLAAASRQFAQANRSKTSDIMMEFSHTQVAPRITFDAVTLQVELDSMLLATATSADNATRYTVQSQIYDCPSEQTCLVRKVSYKAVEPMYDAPAQVVAFRLCASANGSEMRNRDVSIQNGTAVFHSNICHSPENDTANTLLIVAIGKRLVADALEQNVSVAANGSKVFSNESTTITNLRKIYSFTVGRLHWKYTDLGKAFNAECALNGSACLGLALPLSEPLGWSTSVDKGAKQQLVVGHEAALDVLYDLSPVIYRRLNPAKTELLSLNEPPEIARSSLLYGTMAGDILLPHNVRNVTWDAWYVHPQCDTEVEDRIMRQSIKHLYMERSLQTAYTSAMYYLFQNAVVRDEISLSSTQSSLAFQRNSQSITVWVSTPPQSVRLTLGGCAVLVVGLLCAVISTMWFARKEKDALANITEPHAIARVMMDERHYPPIFLHRRIVEKGMIGTVDEFAIAALSLQQQQQEPPQRGQQQSNAKRDCEVDVAFV